MADGETGNVLLTADIQDIKRMIPHRYPFLLIDRVKEIDLNKSAVGIKNVTYNEPHFQGHFPASPIMPGVTIVEAMAQTAAVLVVMTLDMIDNDMLVYFLSIDKCKFRKPVTPGDQLELHVKVIRGRGKLWRFSGEARVDGNVVAEAEFNAMMVPPEDQ
ncbi:MULTISPECIES: 3-hydroxyacyl-ACP dehydratase FabZ [Rhodobacterales]|uniref:3-hydroxyacyl-ACP dehydratase FabZ n=1 Tax=Roseobacter sp. N2S TaxID=2663844 RepID=UPI002866A2A0|nr:MULTISPECIES: 3-hydroxyacyl-ACP dehydratase FabZ [Rhodobacterales]MDR6264642.1 3-hydroxyacyl-[acyl-carrier-protein] dehydratase [Roseobacter sp. N2S]